MTRPQRWIAGIAATTVALLALLAAGLAWWLPSDEELAARIAGEFEQRTGIGLRVGVAHWTLRPGPAITLSELATAQKEPITVQRLVLRADLSALLARRVQIDTVEIEGAVLPRASVRAFRQLGGKAQQPVGGWTVHSIPVEHARFSDLTWIDRRGIALAYDGRIDFDPGWLPRRAEVARRDVTPPARLTLKREAGTDRWRTDIEVAGGTWNGTTTVQTLADQRLRLHAELTPHNVDIALLTAAFKRRAPVDGRLEGSTEVDAEADNPAALGRALHTRTRFTVRPATLLRFDLAKAVATAGISRGGQTPLDELVGTLETQNTEDGVVMRYRDLKARSGLLTASGSVTLLNRKLDGEAAVDLVDGVVGVPLKVGGTVDVPELSLTGGALAGAAVGSAVLPGVGTAIGARIGQKVEQMFGGDDGDKKPKKPTVRGPRSN